MLLHDACRTGVDPADILTCSYVLTTITYVFTGIDHQATGFNASHTVVAGTGQPWTELHLLSSGNISSVYLHKHLSKTKQCKLFPPSFLQRQCLSM
jgi:hypothetical protein